MKKLFALILAFAMLFSFAACGDNTEETTTTTAPVEETTDAAVEVTDAVTDAVIDETETATGETTLAAEETTLAADATTLAEETTATAPATTDEILAVYNDAINGAISAKAGYDKKRVTNIQNLEGGALMKIQLVQDEVANFLGVGTKEYPNAKGKAEFMSKASLTAADVTSADCKESGGKYTITIGLKDGASNSSASGKKDSSPLLKSGLYVGEGDSSKFDYKSADNIYVALNGLDEASVEAVELKTTKAKIVCVVDAATGKIEKLTISFVFNADLTSVKYLVASIKKATGVADTTVTFSNFKY
ncbi:MAG: hypothetical protein E7547_06525 [Ruminococcaceae bacterium]|nr:hypothetical protein [Oscillospiraceae bacterium]